MKKWILELINLFFPIECIFGSSSEIEKLVNKAI